ncbi:MAG: DUF4364 family protein [Bacillota bacterium]
MSNSINTSKYNENAENRLILLYVLDKLEGGATDLHITEFLVENHLMDYFSFQFQLSGLLDAKLVQQRFTDSEFVIFSITPEGRDVLRNLATTLPIGLRLKIDDLAAPLRCKIRQGRSVSADFTPILKQPQPKDQMDQIVQAGQAPLSPMPSATFNVTCTATEDEFELINIDVMAPTREIAVDICHNWKAHSDEIYAEVLEALTKSRG